MAAEFRCPTCGAKLPRPGAACPFCQEAQLLLQQLAARDEVRLCSRCGALIEGDSDDLCPACRKIVSAGRSPWRRDDRIAAWIRDRFVEPVAEREGIACPECGAALAPLAIFCSRCGYKLSKETAQESPPAMDAGTPAASVSPSEATAGPLPQEGAAGPEEPAATGPSWWQRTVDFWREQFRPRGPLIEREALPWWQEALRVLRALLGLDYSSAHVETWLWVVLGMLLVGLVAMFFFWASLLSSGDVLLR